MMSSPCTSGFMLRIISITSRTLCLHLPVSWVSSSLVHERPVLICHPLSQVLPSIRWTVSFKPVHMFLRCSLSPLTSSHTCYCSSWRRFGQPTSMTTFMRSCFPSWGQDITQFTTQHIAITMGTTLCGWIGCLALSYHQKKRKARSRVKGETDSVISDARFAPHDCVAPII